MAGFSDQPIELPSGAETYYDISEAKYVTKYLEDYVDSHIYNGKSLRDRILFNFKVVSLKKRNDKWQVWGSNAQTMSASRVAVATGHASRPVMLALPQNEHFLGPIIYQKYFGKVSNAVFKDSSIPNVTILGGGKSAADMVYASVKAGKIVSWIIRRAGEGPAAFSAAGGQRPIQERPRASGHQTDIHS